MSKKIMFSDKYGLTQAVLDGRKTQTRRIINPQPKVSERMGMVWKGYAYGITSPYGSPNFLKDVYHNFVSGTNYPQCRRYKLGEVVAVAMSYKTIAEYLAKKSCDVAKWLDDHKITSNLAGWLNKMFVKAGLMLFHVRITNVRVERLNDISESDCIAEGVEKVKECESLYRVPIYHKSGRITYISANTPREAYAALIDRISGKGTWQNNPYVFVYDFELVGKEAGK